jgi:hypothetical protein
MNANSFGNKVLRMVLSLAAVLSIASCFSEERLKGRMLDEMRAANGEDISLDLNIFTKDKISKICIQTPYLTKIDMEKRVGSKLDDFDDEVEGLYIILWIFNGRKTPMKIRFHRSSELDFGLQLEKCSSNSVVKIVDKKIYLNQGDVK